MIDLAHELLRERRKEYRASDNIIEVLASFN